MSEFDRFSRRDTLKVGGIGLAALLLNIPRIPKKLLNPEGRVYYIEWLPTEGPVLPFYFKKAESTTQAWEPILTGDKAASATTYTFLLSTEIAKLSQDQIVFNVKFPKPDVLTLYRASNELEVNFFTDLEGRTIQANLDPRFPASASGFATNGKKVDILLTKKVFLTGNKWFPAPTERIMDKDMSTDVNQYIFPCDIPGGPEPKPQPDFGDYHPVSQNQNPTKYYIRVTDGDQLTYYTSVGYSKERTSTT